MKKMIVATILGMSLVGIAAVSADDVPADYVAPASALPAPGATTWSGVTVEGQKLTNIQVVWSDALPRHSDGGTTALIPTEGGKQLCCTVFRGCFYPHNVCVPILNCVAW